MKDIITAFFQTSRERLKNPFLGAFLFSIITVNWKPISILFFSTDIIELRIKKIEDYYTLTWTKFWIVLGITLCYIVVLPYLMWVLEKITYFAAEWRKNILNKQKIKSVKRSIELAGVEIDLEDTKAKLKDKSELNDKIESLKAEILGKDEVIHEMKVERDKLNEAINTHNESLSILKEKDSKSDFSYDDIFSSNYRKSIVIREGYSIDDFEKINNHSNNKGFRKIYLELKDSPSKLKGFHKTVKEFYESQGIIELYNDEKMKLDLYRFTNKGDIFKQFYLLSVAADAILK